MLQILRNSLIKREFISGSCKKKLQFYGKTGYSTQTRLREEDAEEVRIPVPWGHIAGKWWGRKDGIPILGVHGWQDNASSYDKLIPHLNVSNFLAIDLPGHGFSSHYPPGKAYTFLEYIYSLRRVINHFKWKKYAIMGHSLGSALGFAHTAIHKDEVEFLISLECGRYLLLAYTQNFPTSIARGVDKILEYDVQNESTSGYTFQEAMIALIQGSLGSVNRESAATLLKRGATKYEASKVSAAAIKEKTDLNVFIDYELSKSNEKVLSKLKKLLENCQKTVNELKKEETSRSSNSLYKFTKDPRVKVLQFGILGMEYWHEMSENIICPMLSLEGDEGFLKYGSEELYQKGNDILKNHSKHFEHHIVHGNHHLHLNSPENAAAVINNFLKYYL